MRIDPPRLERLVDAAKSGSPQAFEELYRLHVSVVYGILLSRFRPVIAEEATQECFMLAFRKLSELREPSRFGPWIATIARRFDVRPSVAGQPREWREADEEGNEVVGNPELVTDADAVLSAIRQLPAAYRETLVLRLVEGMSGPEIAEATGLDPDSVRVNLHRGMKLLRKALGLDVPEEVKQHG